MRFRGPTGSLSFCIAPSLRICFLILLVLTGGYEAQATTLKPKSTQELIGQSSAIVRALVLKIQEKQTPDGSKSHRHVTFKVISSLKGSYKPDDKVTLKFMGGTVKSGAIVEIDRVPKFQIGEETILFIAKGEREICPLTGWDQGVLRISTDSKTGNKSVANASRQAVLAVTDSTIITANSNAEALPAPVLVSSSDGMPSVPVDNAGAATANVAAAMDATQIESQLNSLIAKTPEQDSGTALLPGVPAGAIVAAPGETQAQSAFNSTSSKADDRLVPVGQQNAGPTP
jgi:hypothetical protein